MAGKPPTDLIREHGQEIAKLTERMDHLQQDLVRVETVLIEANNKQHETQTRLAVLVKEVEQIEKKLEELRSRRWQIWTIIVMAVVAAIISLGVTELKSRLQRPALIEAAPMTK